MKSCHSCEIRYLSVKEIIVSVYFKGLPRQYQGWEILRYSLGRAWIEAILWLGLCLDREFLCVECIKDTFCLY